MISSSSTTKICGINLSTPIWALSARHACHRDRLSQDLVLMSAQKDLKHARFFGRSLEDYLAVVTTQNFLRQCHAQANRSLPNLQKRTKDIIRIDRNTRGTGAR